MTRIGKAVLYALVLSAWLTPSALWAVEEKAADESANIGLITQVRFTKEELTKLTNQLMEVADLLEKTEPETAKVLREAANQAQRSFIAEEMDQVEKHLRKGLMMLAARKEQNIQAALAEVLKILRQGALDINQRMEMLDKWTKALEELNQIIAKQKELERKSHVKNSADRLNQEMAAHSAALEAIVQEQKSLLAEARKTPQGDDAVRKLAELRDAVAAVLEEQTKLTEITAKTPIAKLPLASTAQKEVGQNNQKVNDALKQAAGDKAIQKALDDAKGDSKAVQKAAEKVDHGLNL